jgi:hypothetical protein
MRLILPQIQFEIQITRRMLIASRMLQQVVDLSRISSVVDVNLVEGECRRPRVFAFQSRPRCIAVRCA